MGIRLYSDPNDFGKLPDPPEPPEITEDDFCPDAPECFDRDSFLCKECICYRACLNNEVPW